MALSTAQNPRDYEGVSGELWCFSQLHHTGSTRSNISSYLCTKNSVSSPSGVFCCTSARPMMEYAWPLTSPSGVRDSSSLAENTWQTQRVRRNRTLLTTCDFAFENFSLTTAYLSPLTSMEQPMSEPLSRAFLMMLYSSLGASDNSKYSVTPPVKSSMASKVLPPFSAS